jgi:GntR family transcriptional regulator
VLVVVNSNSRGTGPRRYLARNLADLLRVMIHSGVLRPGDELPSERELMDAHDCSRTTVRAAIAMLVMDRLVETGQGRRPRVADQNPPHQLALHVSGRPGDRVAEPERSSFAFVQGLRAGQVRREWIERRAAVHRRLAAVLPLSPEDTVLERAMTLFVGDEPVLTSTSYLPLELPSDADGWRDVPIGELALVGLAAKPAWTDILPRMPTAAECEALAIGRGNPVQYLARPYEVLTGDARSLTAGVLVVARSDRIYLRYFRHDHA